MSRFYLKNKDLIDKRYKIFKSKVNMTYDEMIAWKKEKCAYSASIKVTEVINRVTKLLKKPKIIWTYKDYTDAGKVISYISRAAKIKDSSKPADKKKGCLKGKNYYALKNWAYDRKKERKNPKDEELIKNIEIKKDEHYNKFCNEYIIDYKIYLDGHEIGRASYVLGKDHISIVYIEPKYQRKGLATYLYDYIEKDQYIKLRSDAITKSGIEFWKNRMKKQDEKENFS